MKLPIYLDHHATTPVDPAVIEAMIPFFKLSFGNASSKNHPFGRQAEAAAESARAQISNLIHAESPEEIVFTSGATESNNMALRGVAELYREKGNHIITSVIEHRSVRDTCKHLESQGFRVTYVPVSHEGLISIQDVESAITDETILISIIHANNEIGTIQPVRKIGKIAKERGILFHSDAAQTIGKIDLDVQAQNIHLASLSAHKMYGPKGVGALYLRKRNPRARIAPLMFGGGHEHGLRPGTLNVPAIVGFGKAAQISSQVMERESKQLLHLREKLRTELEKQLDEVYVNGSLERRLPGNLNMSFAFVEGAALLEGISEEIAVSSGSACTAATMEPSYVLKALGVKEGLTHTSIRFGLGRFNTEEEVNYTIRRVVQLVSRLRELSPLYEIHLREKT